MPSRHGSAEYVYQGSEFGNSAHHRRVEPPSDPVAGDNGQELVGGHALGFAL
jgi:hypothetical protein